MIDKKMSDYNQLIIFSICQEFTRALIIMNTFSVYTVRHSMLAIAKLAQPACIVPALFRADLC